LIIEEFVLFVITKAFINTIGSIKILLEKGEIVTNAGITNASLRVRFKLSAI
jgi:hypothetical protein